MTQTYFTGWEREPKPIPTRDLFLLVIAMSGFDRGHLDIADGCFNELDEMRTLDRAEDDLT